VIALLAFVTVAAFGTWIPLAQLRPGVPQRSRIFYVTVGNVVFAGIALLAGGGHLVLGWRGFWLPLAGGVVWTAGSYSAFRAAETIGIARAAGTWTPLNIIVAFAWGALLFGELDHLSGIRFVLLSVALAAVLAGVLLIVGSQDSSGAQVVPAVPPSPQAIETEPGRPAPRALGGLLWAGAAGLLWGSYFVPAQWAAEPAQVSNFPLALGILGAALALALSAGEPARLDPGPDHAARRGRPVRDRQLHPARPGRTGGHRHRLHHRPAQLAGQRQHRHLGLPHSRARHAGGEEGHRRHRDRRDRRLHHRRDAITAGRPNPP
jgi:hypothetical protein